MLGARKHCSLILMLASMAITLKAIVVGVKFRTFPFM
jgi:hypothetical protein